MAFESLSEKLQGVFKNLRSKGRLTEDDVKAAMREVKRALLEADVNFKVVKTFIKSVQERAVGQDVLNGLNPGQMVIKIVKEEMEALMGSTMTEIQLRPGNEITIILMAGLQGAGKTTTCAKLAGQYKKKGKRPLLVACAAASGTSAAMATSPAMLLLCSAPLRHTAAPPKTIQAHAATPTTSAICRRLRSLRK